MSCCQDSSRSFLTVVWLSFLSRRRVPRRVCATIPEPVREREGCFPGKTRQNFVGQPDLVCSHESALKSCRRRHRKVLHSADQRRITQNNFHRSRRQQRETANKASSERRWRLPRIAVTSSHFSHARSPPLTGHEGLPPARRVAMVADWEYARRD